VRSFEELYTIDRQAAGRHINEAIPFTSPAGVPTDTRRKEEI
jgi:hypothetical protein